VYPRMAPFVWQFVDILRVVGNKEAVIFEMERESVRRKTTGTGTTRDGLRKRNGSL